MPIHKPKPPGLRFGLLTTMEATHGNNKPVLCRCDCGTMKNVRFDHLTRSKCRVVSCGCQRIRNRIKHGFTKSNQPKSTEFWIWVGMRGRCNNPADKSFHKYGGRGIKVCERWTEFVNFLADMGPRPSPSHSLDRYPDNNGPYAPDNCRWATISEQGRNKRTNRLIEVDGATRTLAEWAERTGMLQNTILGRIRDGWSPRDAVLTPLLLKRKRSPTRHKWCQPFERKFDDTEAA